MFACAFWTMASRISTYCIHYIPCNRHTECLAINPLGKEHQYNSIKFTKAEYGRVVSTDCDPRPQQLQHMASDIRSTDLISDQTEHNVATFLHVLPPVSSLALPLPHPHYCTSVIITAKHETLSLLKSNFYFHLSIIMILRCSC